MPCLVGMQMKQGSRVQVVDGWSVELKHRFVAFVTGAQRPCPMGPEVLNVIVAWVPPGQRDQASVLQRLPQVCLRVRVQKRTAPLQAQAAARCPAWPAVVVLQALQKPECRMCICEHTVLVAMEVAGSAGAQVQAVVRGMGCPGADGMALARH